MNATQIANEPQGWNVAAVIARRDLVKFVRQPARIAAAIGTPALLWIFLGGGFAGSFRPAALGETSYTLFLLPGAVTLVAVFASIFASISVIEDRNEGWLQAALVSPAPRWALVVGKVSGSAIVAFVQAAVLLLSLPLLDAHPGPGAIALSLAAILCTCVAMTAMGFIFAWHSETTASFHAVMNIVFMPMWLLSTAFFPAGEDQSAILSWLMRINPLTWCTHAIRGPLLQQPSEWFLLASLGFAIAMLAGAVLMVHRRPRT